MRNHLGHAVVATLLLAPSAAGADSQPAKWRVCKFAGGKAQVSLPLKFQAVVDKEGALEAHTAGPKGEVHLFFELHQSPNAAGAKDGAEAFVRLFAKKKNLKIHEIDGKVFIMEPGSGTVVDGAPVRNMHWQVGFGSNLVVMTMSVRDSEKDLANVKDFFDSEMVQILTSLSVGGA